MPLIVRILGNNVISGAGTTPIYTVPTTVLGAIVRNVRLFNRSTGAGSTQVNVFFTPSGGSQVRILDRDKAISNGAVEIIKEELTMAPSDKIEVTTASGADIDFVVFGIEKV